MTTAFQLCRGGAHVDVFEASGEVGGMSRSLDLWGQRVDLGPHRFFSTDPRVNRLWLDVVGSEYAMVDRLTRIYYKQRFFDYPLKPLNAAWNMGFASAAACLVSYLRPRTEPYAPDRPEATFESWVVSRFGRRLFEMFFRTYSEKLWGVPCHELSADFAAQRIQKLSLLETIRSAVTPQRVGRHRTLVDQFAYPLRGTGSVYESMADRIVASGGTIHRNRPVRRVLHRNRVTQGIELISGERLQFDHVVSTMPLTLLVRGLDDVPQVVRDAASQLQFRNTILIYLHVDSDSLFPDQWLYIHAPELKAGRVTNFRNWVPSLYGNANTSVLAVERWCDPDDDVWNAPDARLIQQATEELRATGLLRHEPVLDGHVVRLPRCYPIYRLGYRDHVACIAQHLNRFIGLTAIGRYGAFKYNNQDHGILMGILTAENLLDDQSHDLWDVNADHACHEGETLLTEAGLTPSPDGPAQRLIESRV